MYKAISYLAAISISLSAFASNEDVQYSGINNVTFEQPENNNAFAGNGFLLEHNTEVYAVTVKHALLEANTPDMRTVSIDGHVVQWQIHPNKEPENTVILGELLNASDTEALDMAILQTDWLVFRVTANNSKLTPVSLRESSLNQGDVVTAYGCTYANAEVCKQDVYTGLFVAKEGANLRISMPGLQPSALRGLSGSPVLDQNNQLVGIISNVFRSLDGNGFDLAPANLDYLKQVLSQLERR